jgi:hypothetical protein
MIDPAVFDEEVQAADSVFSELDIRWLGVDQYLFLEDFSYHHTSGTITVPSGFACDFDSVPRIPPFYSFLKGRAKREAGLHDWEYYSGERFGEPITRKQADQLMRDAMIDAGQPRRYRWPIYWSIRTFGWSAWNKHRSERPHK